MIPTLMNGERQVAPTVAGIRRDHVARYEWAAGRLAGQQILDAGCGVGYGSKILAKHDCWVAAVDRSQDAIDYAREHHSHNGVGRIEYFCTPLEALAQSGQVDAVVAFEVLEHLPDPGAVLRRFHTVSPRLLVSVPNEEAFPFRPQYAHHMRHYRADELEDLLARNGWTVTEWWGQEDDQASVEPGAKGRTIIAVCERIEGEVPVPITDLAPDGPEPYALPGKDLPESVAIVAMGMSMQWYGRNAVRMGQRFRLVDEVWGINNTAGVYTCDRVFHMDDMRLQAARAEDDPHGRIAGLVETLRDHPGPVYTSRAYPEFPGSVDYPLEWVVNRTREFYFNNTIPYAVAFAIALGVKEIQLYGCDYSYDKPGHAHKREKGRACLEYWLAIAKVRGINVTLPMDTQLYDMADFAKLGRRPLYGYDREWVTVKKLPGGRFKVARVDRRPEDVPTVEEINRLYSHDPTLDAPRTHAPHAGGK